MFPGGPFSSPAVIWRQGASDHPRIGNLGDVRLDLLAEQDLLPMW